MATKKPTTPSSKDGKPTEFQGAPTMGTAVISGRTFVNKSVTYYEVNGIALLEGDIALGEVEKVKAATEAAQKMVEMAPHVAHGVGITGAQFRWPNCKIPYEIDPNLPNKQRVTDAIAHWEAHTAFKFPLRTAANAAQNPNYVRFTDAGGCWSQVGMQGGQQTISLGTGCTAGNAIHEIGHTVGLWHEQSREDRDLFVKINWQNIQSGMAAQFNQHITDGDDLGNYDYGSIMHYPRDAFSKNGQDTITPTNPNAQIGQRTALSATDLAAVKSMYPSCGIVKNPVTDPNFKKILDDQRPFKKVLDDIRRPKQLTDPLKQIGDPIFTNPLGLVTNPLTTINPATLINSVLPFSILTPHHADTAAGGMDAQAGEVQQHLLDLEAAIAEARARAAQANADAARLQQASDQIMAALTQAGGGS